MDRSEKEAAVKIGPVGKILREKDGKRSVLIHFLRKIQAEEGYLSGESLVKLSRRLGLPLSEIYSVASFYKQFDFAPRGKKVVRVCMGTACYVRGAESVLNGIKKEFDVKEGETTPDRLLTLETVGCVGCCGLAPVATVNETVVGDVVSKKVAKLIKFIRE